MNENLMLFFNCEDFIWISSEGECTLWKKNYFLLAHENGSGFVGDFDKK